MNRELLDWCIATLIQVYSHLDRKFCGDYMVDSIENAFSRLIYLRNQLPKE